MSCGAHDFEGAPNELWYTTAMVHAATQVGSRWLKASEVAALLAVAVDKVHAWIASGELRGHDLAERSSAKRPRWRISPEDLQRFLLSRQSREAPPKPALRRKNSGEVIQFY